MRFRVSDREWNFAENYFQGKPNGSKLSRKTVQRSIFHQEFCLRRSFVLIDGQVYALRDFLDKGTFARVRWVEDRSGIRYLIKFNNGSKQLKIDIQPELEIERDLGVLIAYAKRVDGSGKDMRIMPYLGISLFSQFKLAYKSQRVLTEEQYKLWLLGSCEQILKLHRGELSKTKIPYLHGDIKVDNFVSDEATGLRLIDFGNTLPCKKGLKVRWPIAGSALHYSHIASEVVNFGEYSFASDVYAYGDLIKYLMSLGCSTELNSDIKNLACTMKYWDPELRPSIEWVYVILLACFYKDNKDLARVLQGYTFAPENFWSARFLVEVLRFAQIKKDKEILKQEPSALEPYIDDVKKRSDLFNEVMLKLDYFKAVHFLVHIEEFNMSAYRWISAEKDNITKALLAAKFEPELAQKTRGFFEKLGILQEGDPRKRNARLCESFTAENIQKLRSVVDLYQGHSVEMSSAPAASR